MTLSEQDDQGVPEQGKRPSEEFGLQREESGLPPQALIKEARCGMYPFTD